MEREERSKEFTGRLSNLLFKTGLSEQQLCQRLGVHRSTLMRWRTGDKPNFRNMVAICENFSHLVLADQWDELVELGGFLHGSLPYTNAASEIPANIPSQILRASENADKPDQTTLPTKAVYLPARLPSLYGRDTIIKDIASKLKDPKGLPVVALCGFPGSGKTELAIAVGHDLLEDGNPHVRDVLWASYKAEDFVPVTLKSARNEVNNPVDKDSYLLAELARQSGCAVEELRRKLASNKCLVIVDNLETAPAIGKVLSELRSLLTPGSKALVTSRLRVEAPYVECITVPGLDRGSAFRLLRIESARRGVHEIAQAKDDVLERLCDVVAGLPLALHWTIGHARDLGLETAISDLEAVKGGVEELHDFLLDEIWARLSVESQQLLVFIAACTSDYAWVKVDREDLEKVSPLPAGSLDRAVIELTYWHLLEAEIGTAPGHILLSGGHHEAQLFTLHPVVRRFVLDHAGGKRGSGQAILLERAIAARLAQLRSFVHDSNFSPHGDRFRTMDLENALGTMKRSLLFGYYWLTIESWWHLEYLVDPLMSYQCCVGDSSYPLAVQACDNLLDHFVADSERNLARQLKGLILHSSGLYASSWNWPSPKEGPEKLSQARAVFAEARNWTQLASVLCDTAAFAAINVDVQLVAELRSEFLRLVRLHDSDYQTNPPLDIRKEFGERLGIELEYLPFVWSPPGPTEKVDWEIRMDILSCFAYIGSLLRQAETAKREGDRTAAIRFAMQVRDRWQESARFPDDLWNQYWDQCAGGSLRHATISMLEELGLPAE